MKKLIITAALILAGCSADSQTLNEHVTVTNANPRGSVGGMVLDGTTEAAIPTDTEVRVQVLAGGAVLTGTVDENGYYLIQDVPASGNVQVFIEADGYLSAQVQGQFTNSAGDFPVDSAILSLGAIGLIPSTGSLTVKLVTDKGLPVGSVDLTLSTELRFLVWQAGQPLPTGQVTLHGTTDSDGMVTFDGLPDYSKVNNAVNSVLWLSVPPLDADGDGIYEFPGNTYALDARNTQGPERIVVLDSGYATTLTVTSTNLPALKNQSQAVPGTIATDAKIYVLFSLPIDDSQLQVRVMNELQTETAATNASIDGRMLTISFPDGLNKGAKYHMQIHAVSSVGNKQIEGDFYAPLYTATDEDLTMTLAVDPNQQTQGIPNPDVIITFNQPIGTGVASRNMFSGGNCVTWFGFDVDHLDGVGNIPGEEGNPSCNMAGVAFNSEERVPAMPAGYASGFSSVWRLNLPHTSPPDFPSGAPFSLHFSRIVDRTRVIITPDGSIVPDQSHQL